MTTSLFHGVVCRPSRTVSAPCYCYACRRAFGRYLTTTASRRRERLVVRTVPVTSSYYVYSSTRTRTAVCTRIRIHQRTANDSSTVGELRFLAQRCLPSAMVPYATGFTINTTPHVAMWGYAGLCCCYCRCCCCSRVCTYRLSIVYHGIHLRKAVGSKDSRLKMPGDGIFSHWPATNF